MKPASWLVESRKGKPMFKHCSAGAGIILALLVLPLGACDEDDAESEETTDAATTGDAGEASTGEGEDAVPPEVCQTVEAQVDCGEASEECVFDDDAHRVCDPIEGEAEAVQCVLDAIAGGSTASLDSGYFVEEGFSMDVHYVIAADGSGWQESDELSGGICHTTMLYAWGATDIAGCTTIECLRIQFEAAKADVCTDDFVCE
jgi:hypothetical protein